MQKFGVHCVHDPMWIGRGASASQNAGLQHIQIDSQTRKQWNINFNKTITQDMSQGHKVSKSNPNILLYSFSSGGLYQQRKYR